MNNKRIVFFCVLLTVVFSCVSNALAGPFLFNSAGSNARFGWSNGQHTNESFGSMGSPDVDALGFHFANSYPAHPMNMSIGPANHAASAEVSVEVNTLNALGGPAVGIDTLTIREVGTYASNDPAGDFDGWGTAWMPFVALPFGGGFAGSVALPAPTFTSTGPGTGTWQIEVVWQIGDPLLDSYFLPGSYSHPDINNAAYPWQRFQITVENDLFLSPQGVTNGASLSKTRMDIFVPEPSSVLLVMLAAGPLAIRRRRCRGA